MTLNNYAETNRYRGDRINVCVSLSDLFVCIHVLSIMQRQLDVSEIVLEDAYKYQTNVFVYTVYEWL